MTKKQMESNQKWFERMMMFLNDGGHLLVPNFEETYTIQNGKIKPQNQIGLNKIKEIVTNDWFVENVETNF